MGRLKNILRQPGKFLDGIMDRVSSVIGAILLAQFPQFYAQYMQRLGGHLDEARRVVEQYEEEAAGFGLTLEEYIKHHLEADSEIFVSSGQVIENVWDRLMDLEASFVALNEAHPFWRVWAFFNHADWEIAARAWQNFTPGVPTTLEGLVYAFVGLLLGWGIYLGIKSVVKLPINAYRRYKGTGGTSSGEASNNNHSAGG